MNQATVWALIAAGVIARPGYSQGPVFPYPPQPAQGARSVASPTRTPPIEDVAPGPAVTQQPAAFSLADIEAMALKNSPAMALAVARVNAAQGQWQQAGLYPNPSAGYLATEVGDDGRAGQQGGYVSQQFVMAGKLGLDQAAAGAEVERQQREADAQRLRVLSDVRVGFYDTLIAQQRVEVTDQLLRVGLEGMKVTDQLLKGMEASRPDLLQARIEASAARILVENARNAHLSAWRRLAAAIGMPQLAPQRLAGTAEGNLAPLVWEESVGRLLSGSPELAAAEALVRRAEAALTRARVEPIPNIDVMVSAQYDNATQFSMAGIQAGVPLPIWNRNQGGIAKAEAELMAARSNVNRLQLELTRRLAAAFERYANARQQVDAYRQSILPDATTSLDLMGQSYRAGEASYLMLLTVQRTYFQSNLAYLEALRELLENTVIMENMLLSDSLVNRELP